MIISFYTSSINDLVYQQEIGKEGLPILNRIYSIRVGRKTYDKKNVRRTIIIIFQKKNGRFSRGLLNPTKILKILILVQLSLILNGLHYSMELPFFK